MAGTGVVSLPRKGLSLIAVMLFLGGCGFSIWRPVSRPSSPPASVTIKPVDATSPVGTQRTLKATVKDAKGKRVHSVLVEWILARTHGAVGDIVEVGQDTLERALKLTNTYAISGADEKGETWITVTSAQEGITDVIAVVSDIKDKKKHKAFAVVKWIAPPLSIQKTCPRPTVLGNTVKLSFVVSNTSKGVARGVTVEGTLPGGLEYVSSSPRGTMRGDTITWDLGDLAAGARKSVAVTAKTLQAGTLNSAVVASSIEGGQVQVGCSTVVTKPAPPPPPPPAPKVKRIILDGVFFDLDKATIKPEGAKVLDQVAEFLKENPNKQADLEGHTDWIASRKYNQGLSERRTASVKRYLVRKGIDPSRISTRGFGETRPRADNRTKEGRAKNRRVEIRIR